MNKRLAAVGLALQAVAGTPAAAPQYYLGVRSGSRMVDFQPNDVVDDDYISGINAATDAYRDGIAIGADFGTRALVKTIGLLLYAILGNKAVAGIGPYTHTFTMGDAIPMITSWGKLDSEVRKLQDGKLDELSLAWDGRKPLDVNATLLGLLPAAPYPAAIPAAAVDDRMGARFRPVGGTFQWDVDGAVLAPLAVKGGSFTFKRNCEANETSATATPDAIDEGALEVDVELKARVTDLSAARTIVTGTPIGQTASAEPVFGSFSTQFVTGAHTLTLAGSRVPWSVETPESDAKGGPVECTFKGRLLVPGGASTPITATLVNDVASYQAI